MTDTRTDYDIHDEAAENALSDAMNATTLDQQQKFLAIAHVEAARAHAATTRELVEEQRTANLIAAFERDAITVPDDLNGSPATRIAYWNGISAAITKRVGLA